MNHERFLAQFLSEKENDHQLEKILLLQRLIRSFYVRRQFEQVRQDYFKTLTDIEGEMVITPVETVTKKLEVPSTQTVVTLPSRDDLLRKREEIAIELLWMEQAIQSRKDYLRLKSRYTTSVS